MKTVLGLSSIALLWALTPAPMMGAESRDQAVRNDRDAFTKEDRWIYNDFTAAIDTAKRTQKPIMVVLRCVP